MSSSALAGRVAGVAVVRIAAIGSFRPAEENALLDLTITCADAIRQWPGSGEAN